MKKEVFEIILAGLLHDLGKLGQRAFRSNQGLSNVSLGLRHDALPSPYQYLHVLYTNEFCDQAVLFLPPDFDRDHIIRTAIYHHQPESKESRILQQADCISSGMERLPDDSENESNFRTVRLRSIFSEIDIGKGLPSSKRVHQLKELDASEKTLLPEDEDSHVFSIPKGQDLREDYKKLWDGLIKSIKSVLVPSPWAFINRILSTIERYVWCVPSATNALPDISLYDHLKTTAAIAGCMQSTQDPAHPFLLIAGDFSGIQKYIFDIQTSKNVAKRLRSRSFFVSMLSEFVAHRILLESGFPLTNCILASGGKHYLLLPNNPEIVRTIQRIKNDIDAWSIQCMNAEIQFNIGMAPLASKELSHFGSAIKRVNFELSQVKLTPFSNVLKNENVWSVDKFLIPHLNVSDDQPLCEGCRKYTVRKKSNLSEEQNLCERCRQDIEIGRDLTRKDSVAFYLDPENNILPGGYFRLISEEKFAENDPYIIINMDGSLRGKPHSPIISAYRARYVPRYDENLIIKWISRIGQIPPQIGDVMTFEHIVDQSTGRSLLGYLKADMDNLGFIFQNGLTRTEEKEATGIERTSISRIATLSRMLDQFFSGYFNLLIKQEFPRIYIVYSGGDDLLCLGPWNEIIRFSEFIRNKFSCFVCLNPNITLSSAIDIFKESTPIRFSVEQTEDSLEKSKKFRPEKNTHTLFDCSIPWGEFNRAYIEAKKLSSWYEMKIVNSGMLYRLLDYSSRIRKYFDTLDSSHLLAIPMLAYDIKRNWIIDQDKPETFHAQKWVSQFLDLEFPDLKYLDFLCIYAIYKHNVK